MRNPGYDERFRQLERAAAQGDLEAQTRLDVEAIKLGVFPLHYPTSRIKRAVRAMLSPEEVKRLGSITGDLRHRYTWQDLAAYLQEDVAEGFVRPPFPKYRKGSKVYSMEWWGTPGWKKGTVTKIEGNTAHVKFTKDRMPYARDARRLVRKPPHDGRELFLDPKVRRAELLKEPWASGADLAALWLDKTRVGTPLYGGLAYFWGQDYKHTLREVPDVPRKAVHDTWLKHGLVLHEASPEHEWLMRAVLRTPRGWEWEGGDLIRGSSYRGDLQKRPGSRWRPPEPLPNPTSVRFVGFHPKKIEKLQPYVEPALQAIEEVAGTSLHFPSPIRPMTRKEIEEGKKIRDAGHRDGAGHGIWDGENVRINKTMPAMWILANMIHEYLHMALPEAPEVEVDGLTDEILLSMGIEEGVGEFNPPWWRRNPYYHGTQKEALRSIRERGLIDPFLSSNEDQAWCWARGYASMDRDGRVLEFEVPNELLVVPDYNIMDSGDRERVLGFEPGEYYDVREELRSEEGRDRLLEAADDYLDLRGRNWVYDEECGGEASIYLGTVPWENIRVVRPRKNPDPRLRKLQRAAATGSAEEALAYARARQRAGEPVEPWELEPLSYVFLEAASRLYDDPPGRVEGRRNWVLNPNGFPFIPTGIRWSFWGEGKGVGALGIEEEEHEEWRIGNRSDTAVPLWELGSDFLISARDLLGNEVPIERFYVCPSSYPMYRSHDEWEALSALVQEEHLGGTGTERSNRLELEMHLRAVDYFVSNGAIPWDLPGPPLSQGHDEQYLEWFDVYRRRVLVAYENLQGARTHAGGWGVGSWDDTHNPRILFPQFWASARLMKAVGEGKRRRWKNPRRPW